jgi:hypothetical protein
LCEVEADAGRQEPNDSPRGESIFVTWSPKIYHEARGGAPALPEFIEEIYFKHFKKRAPEKVRSIEQMVKDKARKKAENKANKELGSSSDKAAIT